MPCFEYSGIVQFKIMSRTFDTIEGRYENNAISSCTAGVFVFVVIYKIRRVFITFQGFMTKYCTLQLWWKLYKGMGIYL